MPNPPVGAPSSGSLHILTIGSHPDLKQPGGVITHMRLLCDLDALSEIEPVDVGSVHGTAALPGHFAALRIVWNIRQLRRRLKTEHFDLVMVHQPAHASALVKLVMILLAIPGALKDRVLVFFHGGRFEHIRFLRYPIVAQLLQRVFRRARRFYFLSRPERAGFVRLFAGVPTAFFSNFAESNLPVPRVPRNDGALVALYVGRVVEVKGVFTLLRAIEHIQQTTREDVRLTVVGNGPDLERLRAEAEAVVPGRVVFRGFLEGEELQRTYTEADLFVLPTKHPEGFPYVVIEAMRAGLPLVATPEGVLETLIEDGVTGFQVRPDDPEGLAQTILRFTDEDLLEQVTATNYAYFNEHLRKQSAERFYRRLVGKVLGARNMMEGAAANAEGGRLVRLFRLGWRYVRTVSYMKPGQLFWRFRYLLRHNWNSLPDRAESHRAWLERLPMPSVRAPEELPKPLLPPKSGLIEKTGAGFQVTFWNQTRFVRLPADWHPADLDHSLRSWSFNLHYMEYLESVDSEDFVEIVRDWIRQNPPFDLSYWSYTWHSYVLSVRCLVWMQQAARRNDALPPDFRDEMGRSLVQQIRFLVRNLEWDVHGNHLLKNIVALIWASRFFEGPEAAEWYRKGEQLLEAQLDEQVLPDGLHYERSPSYHIQVFVDLLSAHEVLNDGPLRGHLFDRLGDMAQALADLTHPDGLPSLFNDSGLNLSHAPADCLEAWRRTSGASVQPRDRIELPDAGYFGIRENGHLLLVDCGPVSPKNLPGHAHGDILAFEWTVDGRRLIVDAGVFHYDAGPIRDLSRSTRLHNTVNLDGHDQCEFWGVHRMARRARVRLHDLSFDDGLFRLEGSHTGFHRLAGRPVHERSFRATPQRIEVTDRVSGGRGQRVEARLLLHPDCSIEHEQHGVLIRRDGVTITLKTEAPVHVAVVPWYPDFGVELQTRQLILNLGTAPCEGSFVLEALLRHEEPAPEPAVEEVAASGTG